MKRFFLYSALSFLPLVALLGISSARAPTTSASVTPPPAEAAPSCRRVHGTACTPEGATIRCSIGDPVEVRVCVCSDRAWDCR